MPAAGCDPLTYFFDGNIAASKSLFNRALIVQSFCPPLQLLGESESDDVRFMQKALTELHSRKDLYCGFAGTTLRFLAFRCSREKGQFVLSGEPRLFARPQRELVKLLSQLGSEVRLKDDRLEIDSLGWKLRGDGVFIDGSESSQFASGVLLNTWNLDKDFFFSVSGDLVSEAYFRMTLELVRSFGLIVEQNASDFFVKAGQKPMGKSYEVEADVSSAFAVAALAVFKGPARIRNFPRQSLQPDVFFISCLSQMGVEVKQTDSGLVISPPRELKALTADLKNSPDLFPVLAVLCAFADGPSQISGVAHLRFKESDRLAKSVELLHLLGAEMQVVDDVVTITPPAASAALKVRHFHPDKDHRMAMAAGVAMAAGAKIDLEQPEVVSKSFPEFWSLAF